MPSFRAPAALNEVSKCDAIEEDEYSTYDGCVCFSDSINSRDRFDTDIQHDFVTAWHGRPQRHRGKAIVEEERSNEWVHLVALDPEDQVWYRYRPEGTSPPIP